jgi:hypothetical protein
MRSNACFMAWECLLPCPVRLGKDEQIRSCQKNGRLVKVPKGFARRTASKYWGDCSAFTLVEVLVAMVFFMICSLGLLTFTMMTFGERKSIERRNFAYAMASDIAERLKFLPSNNALVKPLDSHSNIFLKYENGEMKDCGGQSVNMWELVNPLNQEGLYLYDANHNGTLDGSEINPSVNDKIDHPSSNDATSDLSIVRPIRRSPDGTTYYAVWSVRYLPCNVSDQTKVVIAVYWIEPEPTEGDASEVASKIYNGVYRLKNVTISTDIVYGVL